MKHFVFIFTMCVIALNFTSCKKIEDKTRSVYGQIVDDSSGLPIQTTTFVLITAWEEGFPARQKEENFTFATDENGNFRVNFKARQDAAIGVMYPGGSLWDGGNGMKLFWSYDAKKETEINAGVIKASKP